MIVDSRIVGNKKNIMVKSLGLKAGDPQETEKRMWQINGLRKIRDMWKLACGKT
jgi:hypothetical protein